MALNRKGAVQEAEENIQMIRSAVLGTTKDNPNFQKAYLLQDGEYSYSSRELKQQEGPN